MTSEEHFLQEIESLKKELEATKKRADENEGYRDLIEGRIKRNAKDSVFNDLFSRPEYMIQLYKELFPNDTSITSEDLELFRVQSILTNHPYNDIGILVRRKLIMLGEEESEWSDNIIYRLLAYYLDSADQYIHIRSMNVHAKMKIDLLDVEAFVFCPRGAPADRDTISLRDVFFNGEEGKPDFTARIIRGDHKGGIIAEYMGFCHVLDEKRSLYKNAPNPEKWIDATIDECIARGFLVAYMREHRTEVAKIMLEMYNPRQVDETEKKTEMIFEDISFGREGDMSEDKIKETIMRRYNLTSTYAQRCLDERPRVGSTVAVV